MDGFLILDFIRQSPVGSYYFASPLGVTKFEHAAEVIMAFPCTEKPFPPEWMKDDTN